MASIIGVYRRWVVVVAQESEKPVNANSHIG